MRVIEKLPLSSAVVVPNTVVPLKRVTSEPGSAFPDIVGVGSSESEIRVSDVGDSGAVVSIVMDIEDDSEVFPASSVAFTVRV